MTKLSFPSPFIAAGILLLATACAPAAESDDASGGDGEATTGSASDRRDNMGSVSETGWLTVGSDGAVQTTFFDADGRYRDLRNGALLAGGDWEQRTDGTICFEPDAGLGACWETAAADENGTAIATNSEGKSIAIKQVTYIAPQVDESEDTVGG